MPEKSDAPKDSPSDSPWPRNLLLGGVLVLASVVTFVMWPRADRAGPDPRAVNQAARPSAAPASSTPSDEPVRAQPAAAPRTSGSPPAQAPRAEPSLFDEPAPELLTKAHEVVKAGTPMRSHKTKALYDYGKANPTDARPWLLLATDDMNRGWSSFAVRHYRMAHDADPRMRHEPQVAKDLTRIATSSEHRSEALEVLRDVYGGDLRTEVEAQLELAVRAGDDERTRKIERLLADLD